IDINPSNNPNRSTKTDMPVSEVRKLVEKWGLGWGMDWKSVKDPMHFSVA
ncbi:M15 family metallopeptidase, partial [Escherichia coli]|nr:M15 family metallopeptidase [Escherichia coli]